MKRKSTEFKGLKEHYSIEEAKAEVEQILSKYSSDCRMHFFESAAEISNSYKVTSLSDRHRICAIIARSGVTERSYENLSAEWQFHNISWFLHFKRASAKDVTLDYKADPRMAVRLITSLFDKLDIE